MLLFSFALPSVVREAALSFIILVSLLTPPFGYNDDIITYAQEEIEGVNASIGDEDEEPFIKDPNLGVELVSLDALEFPTSMAFLGPDDILVLEKDKGTVQRIVNGKMLLTPVLTVDVASQVERCMCGIAVSKSDSGTVYVFLYFTEAEDGGDGSGGAGGGSSEPVGNRLYRYEWINNQLVNPILLLDLPATPGPRHNGGAVMIGPDNNVYVIIGDVDGHETLAQNQESGEEPDGTSGILRVTQDGQPVGIDGDDGILGNTHPLNLYYAYGIRNSFGFDFDPVTGNIWDTENGPGYGDEINLVEPGFNSGWSEITGFPSSSTADTEDFDPEEDIVSFEGKGKYSDPEFEWTVTLGPTAVKFLNSDKLGAEYVNDMFVTDIVTGRIYHFDLNEDRTELVLEGPLADKVAETRDTGIENIIFAEGFGGISDLEVGPDGYLYVVSLGHGAIYRILPAADVVSTTGAVEDIEEEDQEDIEAVEEEEMEEEEEDSDED
jgi:aldose sugar dehydrogenase